MVLFRCYRCLFANDAFIEQYGLGTSYKFMIKATGCCLGGLGIVCVILIFTSPVGARAVFAYGATHASFSNPLDLKRSLSSSSTLKLNRNAALTKWLSQVVS